MPVQHCKIKIFLDTLFTVHITVGLASKIFYCKCFRTQVDNVYKIISKAK